jgi:hypothetical protein
MLLVVDHQQNYSCVMEDVNINRSIVCSIARNFAIKHKANLANLTKQLTVKNKDVL